nr:uncharacterized protein LOC129388325 [Dermacentor andersoni]
MEPAQVTNDGSVHSRSLVETGLETAPRSVHQSVKERSDFAVDETFTPWKKVQLEFSVVRLSYGRFVLQLRQSASESLPAGVKAQYNVLFWNKHCIIILDGEYPPPGVTTECYFWTIEEQLGKSNYDCEFIWSNYCHFPTEVPFGKPECK